MWVQAGLRIRAELVGLRVKIGSRVGHSGSQAGSEKCGFLESLRDLLGFIGAFEGPGVFWR